MKGKEERTNNSFRIRILKTYKQKRYSTKLMCVKRMPLNCKFDDWCKIRGHQGTRGTSLISILMCHWWVDCFILCGRFVPDDCVNEFHCQVNNYFLIWLFCFTNSFLSDGMFWLTYVNNILRHLAMYIISSTFQKVLP